MVSWVLVLPETTIGHKSCWSDSFQFICQPLCGGKKKKKIYLASFIFLGSYVKIMKVPFPGACYIMWTPYTKSWLRGETKTAGMKLVSQNLVRRLHCSHSGFCPGRWERLAKYQRGRGGHVLFWMLSLHRGASFFAGQLLVTGWFRPLLFYWYSRLQGHLQSCISLCCFHIS